MVKNSKSWKHNWNKKTEDCVHDENACCCLCNPQLFNPSREEAVLFSTEAITEQVVKAKRAYYAGKPILRDEEYDQLEDTLKAINPDAEVLNVVGSDK